MTDGATEPDCGPAIYWEVSTRCNGRCRYCSAAAPMAAAAARPLETREALVGLDRLRRAGAARIVFLGGEPTLREDLPDLIGEAVRLGMSVGIATNGLSLSRRLRDLLLGLEDVSVHLSLDSLRASENDAVRGSGYHAACLRTLRGLLRDRRQYGSRTRITLQATVTLVNLARLESTLFEMGRLGVDTVLVDRMKTLPWQSDEVQALAPNVQQWIAAAGAAARAAVRLPDPQVIQLNYGLARLRSRLIERYQYSTSLDHGCPAGLATAVVDFAGRIHPCRQVLQRPIPLEAGGRPWFTVEPIDLRDPEAARFLDTGYFVDFFNFAHSVRTYEGLALCRTCEHYPVCDPCPLDVSLFRGAGPGECRALEAGCQP